MDRLAGGTFSWLKPETFNRLVEAALPPKTTPPLRPEGPRKWKKRMPASKIAPRPWLVGDRLLRGQFAVLAAPGGTGKSSMALATALSVASGAAITGEYLHATGNAWVINNEDPYSELNRRLIALRDYHGVGSKYAGEVFLSGAPETEGQESLLLAYKRDPHSDVVIHEETFKYIEGIIAKFGIIYCSMDPFISLISGIDSNDNDAISKVARRVRDIAFKTGCAIEVVAHTNKTTGAERAGNPNVIRGASTLVDTARIATTLMQMSLADAKVFLGNKAKPADIDKLRARFFRSDIAKGNFSRRRGAVWYEMVSHELGQGDEIGVPLYVGGWNCLLDEMAKESEEMMGGLLWVQDIIKELSLVLGVGSHQKTKVFERMGDYKKERKTAREEVAWKWSGKGSNASGPFEDAFPEVARNDVHEISVFQAKKQPHQKGGVYLIIKEIQ
jgi:hypothetical protein